jgi:phosphatidylglycerophosphatase A
MCISLLFIPVTINYVIAALVLFRFFDIVKPFYIKKMEALPGGLGVMMDDVLAGIYANIVLQIFLLVNPFHY